MCGIGLIFAIDTLYQALPLGLERVFISGWRLGGILKNTHGSATGPFVQSNISGEV